MAFFMAYINGEKKHHLLGCPAGSNDRDRKLVS